MMRLIGILSIHGLLSLSYLNIFISTTLFPVVSAYQINEGCDKELEVLSKCTQEKCYTDLDDYLPDSDITCDSYEYTDLCILKYQCADCGEFFQALKDCALPNCPDCEDLKCFTENIEVNSCIQKEFFTCQECFAYFEGTDPNQPSCDDIPSLCQASRCCDSCAVVIQAAMDCFWGPTCSTNDAESIECASIPPVSAPLPPDDDNGNFFFTDDSLSGSDCNQELTALNECNLASSCSETYNFYTSLECGDATHKNLCYIDSICPDCTTAFQAFKECALPDCKECTELEECYREGSDLLNCLDDNPSCEDKCFAFLQPIVPFYGYGFCYEAPYLCMASSCCESCTTEFEEVTKCGNTFCDYSDCDDVLPVCSQEYGELYQCTLQSGCFLSSLPALFETTCDNSGFRELCLIGSVCDNCVEAYQAVNECALAGCPGCAELECFTEEVELNNCVNRDFFCATNLGYYSERCEYLPEICRESRSCEGCATEYENYVNCAYAPACAISGDSINCDDIPDPDDDFFGNDDGSFGGDNTTFGDDFFGNNDDTFGDDGVSLECQDLATEFMKCISINLVCLFTSPKCIELGTFEDGGSGDETEDEFTCEGVPQACAEFTCCETCADSARNFIECEANEYNCSETCDDEINTLPGEGDGIVGGTISSSPIAPVPISLAPVTPEPVTPASVTPLPSTSAPVTPKPVTPAPVTPLPSTSAPVTTEPIATPSITPNTSPPTMADQPVNKTEVEKENIVTSFNNLDNWVRNIIIGSCAIVGALILFVCVRSCSDSA